MGLNGLIRIFVPYMRVCMRVFLFVYIVLMLVFCCAFLVVLEIGSKGSILQCRDSNFGVMILFCRKELYKKRFFLKKNRFFLW